MKKPYYVKHGQLQGTHKSNTQHQQLQDIKYATVDLSETIISQNYTELVDKNKNTAIYYCTIPCFGTQMRQPISCGFYWSN